MSDYTYSGVLLHWHSAKHCYIFKIDGITYYSDASDVEDDVDDILAGQYCANNNKIQTEDWLALDKVLET